MRRATGIAAILLVALPLLGAAGCGSDAPPDMRILTAVRWNGDPTSTTEIGYQVGVDFGWLDRSKDCFPLSPNLRLHVNDREIVPTADGLCQWDILVNLTGYLQDTPVDIRITDGDRVLGTAVYTDLFPGAGAQLVSPTGGTVHAGERIVVTIPSGVRPAPGTFGGQFYWRDPPEGVPPFYTFTPGSAGAASGTIETTAPMMTGRAVFVVSTVYSQNYTAAATCEGFTDCLALPDSDTLGPIEIEVVP